MPPPPLSCVAAAPPPRVVQVWRRRAARTHASPTVCTRGVWGLGGGRWRGSCHHFSFFFHTSLCTNLFCFDPAPCRRGGARAQRSCGARGARRCASGGVPAPQAQEPTRIVGMNDSPALRRWICGHSKLYSTIGVIVFARLYPPEAPVGGGGRPRRYRSQSYHRDLVTFAPPPP